MSRRPDSTSFAARSVARQTRRELLGLGLILAAVAAGLLTVTGIGVYTLSGVRAYVAGEGLYSKAQKEATYHLSSYLYTGNRDHYTAYREAIRVPQADGEARRALRADPPDRAAARDAFIRGRNHPDDAGALMDLFLRASWIAEMQRGIEIWGKGDGLVAELDALAQQIHREVSAGGIAPARRAALAEELARRNHELTELQDLFSETLGAGARRLRNVIFSIAVGASVLLLIVALYASRSLLRALRRSDVRFQSMIEHAHDVITILDASGNMLYNSPSLFRTIGYRPEEIEGQGMLEVLHPDDHPVAVEALARIVEDPSRAESLELRARHRDGHLRTIAVTATGFPREGGPPLVVVNSRDFTEERVLEERLREAQRMESVGRLAGGIAHDFNNILTAILGSAELAEVSVAPDEPAATELMEIRRAAERAADLTAQLLAFARRQVVEPRVFDLNEVVREMESMLHRLIDETIELRIRPSPQPLGVRADPSQMQQVILNLVVNARDAMPQGGELDIAVGSVKLEADEALAETDGRAGEYVRLEVRDTGEAMSPEVREHIFEPFFTTKEQGKGVGLGLATCYGIVRQAGGYISVASKLGRGTRFRVHLPLRAVLPQQPSEVSGEAMRGGAERVLLVEDEASLRRIAVRSLESRGYDVIAARDGLEALQIMQAGPIEIDLLITDVVMPRMGGRELASALLERDPSLRVLFISGYTEDPQVLADIGPAKANFMQKPFRPSQLAQRVGEILGEGDDES